MSDAPALLTASEVSRLARVSVQTVYRWAKSEDGADPVLPAVVLGGIYRWRRADVEAFTQTAAGDPDEPTEAAS